MTLLFITQKLHGQDAFGVLWIRGFIKKGYAVRVICLEASDQQFEFDVHSLGKEKGHGKLGQIFRFWKLITTLQYDRVFIHMAPVWGLLGAWYWILTRTPVYLWYTHYKMQAGLRLLGWYGKRLFCATSQSLPQYPSTSSGQVNAKKVVVGHGIDLNYWPKRENHATDPTKLLMVHRLSRSKRVELSLRALTLLPNYTLDIYGIEAEKDYVAELKKLVDELHLNDRVTFKGTTPMETLPEIYANHRLILNMASETIDKTMLEAMTCGCYPVTTKANAEAIGLRPAFAAATAGEQGYGRQVGISEAPSTDTPEAIADFVLKNSNTLPVSANEMYRVVAEKHSLEGLIAKMDMHMRKGI